MVCIVRKYEDYVGKRRGYDGGKWPPDFTSKLRRDVDGYLYFSGSEGGVGTQVYGLRVYLQDNIRSIPFDQ